MIIGLTGKARSGKDTAAHYLEARGFYHYWFSKPMKEAAKIMFDWTDDHVYGYLKEAIDERYGVSPRHALQTLGTEWGRDMINKNIWRIRAVSEINKFTNVVISDVRFDNEAQMIRDYGGIVIEIQRDFADKVKDHVSEKGVDRLLIDVSIQNNSTIESLYKEIDKIVGYRLSL